MTKKQTTINQINREDDKCFQYAVTVSLNHQNIKNKPERISKIKPFIDRYDWNEIESPSYEKDWNKFGKNNKSIALNVLLFPQYTKQIRSAYVSKYNSNKKNQIIISMINDNNEKWHNLAAKSLYTLLTGITSTNNGDFYCLNCFDSFRTKNVYKT